LSEVTTLYRRPVNPHAREKLMSEPEPIIHEDDTGEVDTGEIQIESHYFELHYATGRLPYVYVEVGGKPIIEGYVVAGVPPRRQQGKKRWRS
jgi:hypothetical protein